MLYIMLACYSYQDNDSSDSEKSLDGETFTEGILNHIIF